MSRREAAMRALEAALTPCAEQVLRRTDQALDVTPGGLIVLAEGDANSEALLSPLSYAIDQEVELRIDVEAADEAARDAALDAILLSISNAITADRTLGGAVDWTDIGPPQLGALELDGAGGSALVMVTLSYTVAGSPLA